jgi:hypothetical protein
LIEDQKAMLVSELFEQAVSVAKTVWRKRGAKLTRAEISRLVATERPSREPKTDEGERHAN